CDLSWATMACTDQPDSSQPTRGKVRTISATSCLSPRRDVESKYLTTTTAAKPVRSTATSGTHRPFRWHCYPSLPTARCTGRRPVTLGYFRPFGARGWGCRLNLEIDCPFMPSQYQHDGLTPIASFQPLSLPRP